MAVFPDPTSMLSRWAAFSGIATALGFPDLAYVVGGGRLRRRPAVAVLDDAAGSVAWWTVVAKGGGRLLWGYDRQDPGRVDVLTEPEAASIAAVATERVGAHECSFAFVQSGDEWATVGSTAPRWPSLVEFLSTDEAAVAELATWVDEASGRAGHAGRDDVVEQVETWVHDVGRGRATSDVLRRLLGPLATPELIAAGIGAVTSFDRARAEL